MAVSESGSCIPPADSNAPPSVTIGCASAISLTDTTCVLQN